MKIKRMIVENFLSFGKAEFDFDEAGLVLVEGENLDDRSARSNGSGKSAMIDALVWCLYGTTLRGYENDEVINRKVGEDCSVMVILEDDHGEYGVHRARKHSRYKNLLTLSTQGADASGANNSETQEIVEKLLGCTKRTFLSSVVFGQDRAYRFSQLTDKEQKEILDEVLGMERFSAACAAARVRLSEVSTAVVDFQRDFERAEAARDQAGEEAAELCEKDESFEVERSDKLEAEREKLRKAKEWLKKNLKVDSTNTQLQLAARRGEVTGCEKLVAKATQAEAEAKIALGTSKGKLAELQGHEKRHEKLTGDCPTCLQPIDRKHHTKVLGQVSKAIEKVEATHAELEKLAKNATKDLDDAKRRLKDARAELLVAEKVHNEAIGAEANAKAWKSRVIEHEKRIAELVEQENPYAAMIKKVEARREKHRKEAALLQEQLTNEEARVKLADFWVKAFGAKGLRSLLIDSSLPLLNEEAARISRSVTGGAITIEFSALSELKSGKTIDRFEVKVDNKHGAGSYLGNSAGERAKVDLCVGLALQRLVASRSSASFNVCFFDEVFDHLDGAAHERVVDVLSEIDKDSVFVVSHDEDLKAWFPASLRIVKKGGFSAVES